MGSQEASTVNAFRNAAARGINQGSENGGCSINNVAKRPSELAPKYNPMQRQKGAVGKRTRKQKRRKEVGRKAPHRGGGGGGSRSTTYLGAVVAAAKRGRRARARDRIRGMATPATTPGTAWRRPSPRKPWLWQIARTIATDPAQQETTQDARMRTEQHWQASHSSAAPPPLTTSLSSGPGPSAPAVALSFSAPPALPRAYSRILALPAPFSPPAVIPCIYPAPGIRRCLVVAPELRSENRQLQ